MLAGQHRSIEAAARQAQERHDGRRSVAGDDENIGQGCDKAFDDPDPVLLIGDAHAAGPFVLLGDHAGDRIPARLADLGLSARDRARHIAVDIGVAALGRALSERLAAPFIAQRFSRLVIDCNREPRTAEAIPATSDGTAIPGNADLDPRERAARIATIHAPYHARIAALLDARVAQGLSSVVVALHSFTPMLLAPISADERRPWTVGVLHDRGVDSYAARVLMALQDEAAGETAEIIGDNQPYAFDGTDYTVPRHAVDRGLAWVELEIRQDQLESPESITVKADLIATVLKRALSKRNRHRGSRMPA